MKPDLIIDQIREINPEAVIFDGLNDAIIGMGSQSGKDSLLIYSAKKIIKLLVKGGMKVDEAKEYYDFNIQGLWAGEMTPIIMEDF